MNRTEVIVAGIYTAALVILLRVASSHQWIPDGFLTLISVPLLAVIWTQHLVRRSKHRSAKK